MKNVLITGGAGFIGSQLVSSFLAETDWKVCVLDDFNNSYSPVLKYHNLAPFTKDPRLSLFGGDISSEAVVEGLFEHRKFHCIIHLADKRYPEDARNGRTFEAINIQGTLNLLNAARKSNVESFIFGSSAEVYGTKNTSPLSETLPIEENESPFALTKSIGESLCHSYTQLHKMRCVCLRFFNVYGPRQDPHTLLFGLARAIENGTPISLRCDSDSQFDYVFVSDIVDGIKASIDYDRTSFEIFNLGSGSCVSIGLIIEHLESIMKRPAKFTKALFPAEKRTTLFAQIEKARTMLGFEPKVSIEDGIRSFVDWFQTDRMWEKYQDFPDDPREKATVSGSSK